MCGVAGVLSFKGDFEVTDQYLSAIRDSMYHRGPDGRGVWIDSSRRVGLAHRRLSIIDLSNSADQPMTNSDGTVVLSFNGEIYNHTEIRKELFPSHISTGKLRTPIRK